MRRTGRIGLGDPQRGGHTVGHFEWHPGPHAPTRLRFRPRIGRRGRQSTERERGGWRGRLDAGGDGRAPCRPTERAGPPDTLHPPPFPLDAAARLKRRQSSPSSLYIPLAEVASPRQGPAPPACAARGRLAPRAGRLVFTPPPAPVRCCCLCRSAWRRGGALTYGGGPRLDKMRVVPRGCRSTATSRTGTPICFSFASPFSSVWERVGLEVRVCLAAVPQPRDPPRHAG